MNLGLNPTQPFHSLAMRPLGKLLNSVSLGFLMQNDVNNLLPSMQSAAETGSQRATDKSRYLK